MKCQVCFNCPLFRAPSPVPAPLPRIMTSPAQSPPTRACPQVRPHPMKRQRIQTVSEAFLLINILVDTWRFFLFPAEPPSYQSLFRQISLQLSQTESQGSSTLRILCGLLSLMVMSVSGLIVLISATLFIIVLIGAPLTMIIMGSLHIHDCPAQRFIPIFLIVSGRLKSVWIFFPIYIL